MKVLAFARETVIFLERDGIIGWKFRQVQITVEFPTGVLFLKCQVTE